VNVSNKRYLKDRQETRIRGFSKTDLAEGRVKELENRAASRQRWRIADIKTHPNWHRCVPETVQSRNSRGRSESPPISRASAAGCKTAQASCPPSRSTTTGDDEVTAWDTAKAIAVATNKEQRNAPPPTRRSHPSWRSFFGYTSFFRWITSAAIETAPRARAQRKERSIRTPVWRSNHCSRALPSGEGLNIERSKLRPDPLYLSSMGRRGREREGEGERERERERGSFSVAAPSFRVPSLTPLASPVTPTVHLPWRPDTETTRRRDRANASIRDFLTNPSRSVSDYPPRKLPVTPTLTQVAPPTTAAYPLAPPREFRALSCRVLHGFDRPRSATTRLAHSARLCATVRSGLAYASPTRSPRGEGDVEDEERREEKERERKGEGWRGIRKWIAGHVERPSVTMARDRMTARPSFSTVHGLTANAEQRTSVSRYHHPTPMVTRYSWLTYMWWCGTYEASSLLDATDLYETCVAD